MTEGEMARHSAETAARMADAAAAYAAAEKIPAVFDVGIVMTALAACISHLSENIGRADVIDCIAEMAKTHRELLRERVNSGGES